ncbi:ABC transporter permease [Flavobacteriaceae bacterium]|jgi:putative ABC transport system permease protein|uniref:ABC transporter permease n=1 Tax=Candidatus Arcticimaribacter forsetii TaxID=2820661 RepID=UPI00207798EE|nr:ABC transporter permease [Candidatus Arcticimaribacter forsetii]MDA8639769.1 ABC transporter permease [Flavobacteriaceae bacterium]MDB2325655.1 ABC transporter permease [Flavobacteriaceae bacterium]MDB2329686.1 ABC transporter permease [Flavobacteriaceae bacterium]MDB4620936.1 ABC transporter permease [Flavobacteriaceae bacterium]MDB4643620.1 ABC transporter permease [Flavobacteriaceae bacterium]
MFSRDRWLEIFETIRKNKLRTFLSGFTVALGIFIFIILFGFGNGLKNQFQEFFLDDATNTISLFAGKTSKPYKGFKSNRRIEFDNSDLADIKENFPFFLEYITPRISRGATVKYKNEFDNYTTRGVGPAHQFAEKTIIMKGRYINEDDVKNKTKYAVIGRLVAQDLFGQEDAIGKFIDVGNSVFKVIGVFQDDGGDREERYIYIPYTTRQLLEKSNDKVDEIVLAFKPQIGHSGSLVFERKLREFLKKKKSIAPSDPNGIFFRNRADALKQNQQFANVLQLIVTFVGLGTLIAGIIGISNIMVFVVKERTKELGIRKALGATPKSVIQMILHESIFITTISGYVGLFIGIFVLKSIGVSLQDYFIKDPYIDTSTALFATVILILFGGIAGYIPAKRAARIKPIVALRDE